MKLSSLRDPLGRSGRLLAVAVFWVGASVWGTAVVAQTPAPPAEEPAPKFEDSFLSNSANVKVGRDVWEQQCRHCHGSSAYPGKAPKLRPGMYTPDFIYDRVTYGFKGMPPWKEVFSLQQRMAVVAYIKSDSFSP